VVAVIIIEDRVIITLTLTSITNTAVQKKLPFLDKVYWGINSIWSIGYFVSTVGINQKTIRRYAQKQAEEDSGQAKLEF
jgi:putative transposase